ncbi:neuronal acetylcholine receptor subunit alpha-7-like [Ruditapes philippinarum]|uniref:neuronal acetylcholine receptor subunit alpha-7-like n=1 Tax=Ruditapes philippinarum TaxID=129788 RepID=UPI00295B28FC|nr:neuronal acetylcholine receptor subunit alpha-7-like [Ruditapes philippinarum]
MLPGLTEYRAKLSSSGTVYYGFPTVLHSVCRVRVTYFPFDTQECGLKFGSWSHTQLDIDFYPTSPTGDLSSFITNNEWIVTEITAQRNVIMYLEPYADVNFIVIMARRPDHYVMTMLFPCILIGATAAIGFLLPAESGEKISLEVTVLLSQSVFLLVISDFLPPSADDFPILGLYFAVSMLLVGLSLVMSVFVLNVHHRGDVKGKTVPSWTRRYLLQNPRNQCFSNKYDVDSVDTMDKENKGYVQNESRRFTNSVFLGGRNYKLPKSEPNAAYKRNCNCARPEETNTNINVQNERTQSKNTIAQLDMNGPTEKLHRNDSVFSTGNQQLLEVSLPKEHRRMLRNIERHFALNDEEENVREDWQKLARILDRVCLLLYILCFSIVTLIYVLKLISGREGPSRT